MESTTALKCKQKKDAESTKATYLKMMKTFDNGTTTAAADQEDLSPPRSCISIEVPLVSSGKASVDKMVTSMTFPAVSPVVEQEQQSRQQQQVEITQRVGLHLLHLA